MLDLFGLLDLASSHQRYVETRAYRDLTKGRICGATCLSLPSMAARLTLSQALRPSNDTTVASGSSSVAARSMAARLSVPALVLRANWYGRVASSNTPAKARASARDTSLRNTSPVAMPRTPPPGLRNAVSRDKARASMMPGGRSARAKQLTANAKTSRAAGSSRSNL